MCFISSHLEHWKPVFTSEISGLLISMMNIRNEFSLLRLKVFKICDWLKYFEYTPYSYMSRAKKKSRETCLYQEYQDSKLSGVQCPAFGLDNF